MGKTSFIPEYITIHNVFFRIFFRDFFRCPPFLTWQRTFTNKLHQVLHIFLVVLRIFEGFLWIFEGFLWICEGFLWIFEEFLWFFKDCLDFDGFVRSVRDFWSEMPLA